MTNQSIGRGPAHGNNENHDGDPTHKTLGEGASQDDPPVGNDVLVRAAPEIPAGVPGARAKAGIRKGPLSSPDGPNGEDSPRELDAARGKRPQGKP